MTTRRALCAFTLLMLATGGCAERRRVESASHSEPTPINDDRFMRSIEAGASRLCDAGMTMSCEELGQQLSFAGPIEARGLPAAATPSRPLPDVYDECSRGVLVIVRVAKCGKCPLWHHRSEGSGFVLTEDGLAVTCRHLFDKRGEGAIVAADRDGVVYPVTEVVASSVPDDVALFHIDRLRSSQESGPPRLWPVPLRSCVRVGESVSIVAHPRHHHFVLTRGIVSRRAERFGGVNGGLKDYRERPTAIVNVTADFGSGSSGGPVLDDAGNVVAMVASTVTVHSESKKDGETSKDGDTQMVMKTCIPAESILRLLGR